MAEIYNSQYHEEQRKKYRTALETLPASKDNRILDVGCGTGLFTEEVVELGSFIVGVDCSKNMIKKAKQEYGNRGNSFLCADADYLPFLGRAFDRVFSFTLLQNMPNLEETVVEICRVAKIGSWVVLTATKKKFRRSSFLNVLNKGGLAVINFVDNEEVKDFIAVCQVM